MTREQIYKGQLQALGVYDPAFDPLIKDLAKAERRRTRAEKEWAKTAPPGGKPSFLDPHYLVVEALDRKIQGYRESMGLTPKALRKLRGPAPAGPDEPELITQRLDLIAQRVSAYALPLPHSLDSTEAESYAAETGQAWAPFVSDSDTDA